MSPSTPQDGNRPQQIHQGNREIKPSDENNEIYCDSSTFESGKCASRFSVDIVTNASLHIGFLRACHSKGVSISKPSEESIRRYRDLWLPMVHQHQRENIPLIPPVDIAWLWHCHRLATVQYEHHLKAQFGPSDCEILDANPPFALQDEHEEQANSTTISGSDKMDRKEICENTQRLWETLYPKESFFWNEENGKKSFYNSPNDENYKHSESRTEFHLTGFDLVACAERQATFLWQVSGQSFSDQAFLEDGLRRYYDFIRLRNHAPMQIIVPTYQIDLMWHTHILSSLSQYHQDCDKVIGRRLHHDDNFNDRTEDGPLDRAYSETKSLWKGQYGEDYFVSGGMYKGEPPKEYYHMNWLDWLNPDVDYLLHEWIATGPFLHLIDLQGASSTNPDPTNAANTSNPPVLWCWKEDPKDIHKHSSDTICGDPQDGWIKYNETSSAKLEKHYQEQKGKGEYSPGHGHIISFSRMILTKKGKEREVRRIPMNGSMWNNIDGSTEDGKKCFVAPYFATATWFTNEDSDNLFRQGYIYGAGCHGVGYYHLSTKSGYEVLLQRIDSRVMDFERYVNRNNCCLQVITCGLLGGRPPQLERLQQKLDDMKMLESIVSARARSLDRNGVVGLSTSDPSIVEKYYGAEGNWLVPQEIYEAGGGCGAAGYDDNRFEACCFYGRRGSSIARATLGGFTS